MGYLCADLILIYGLDDSNNHYRCEPE